MNLTRRWTRSTAGLLLGSLFVTSVLGLSPAAAQDATSATPEPAVAAITTLLRDFLANVDQAAAHDRMWATDLVYTSSAGLVSRKADIMQGFPAAAPDSPATATAPTRYSAEDILVRPFGSSAALTFQLVAEAADGSRSHYRNSGMFVQRDGQWQAVTWHATRVPEAAAATP